MAFRFPRLHTQEWYEHKAQLLKKGTSGLKWTNVGTTKPSKGKELSNSALATALKTRTELTKQEFDVLRILDLRMDDFIMSGDSYFKPAQGKEDIINEYLRDYEDRQRMLRGEAVASLRQRELQSACKSHLYELDMRYETMRELQGLLLCQVR
jgi:hypothetical protein